MLESTCPQHGPYDAKLGACPYCARAGNGRPQNPAPLDDEMPTDPFGGAAPRGGGYVESSRSADYGDDAPTDWPGHGGAGSAYAADDEPTEMPVGRGGRRGRAAEEEDEIDSTVIDRPQTGLLGWLVVKSGGRYGHMYKIKPGALIGRDARKADMILDDEKISGLHAKLMVKEGRFVLWDLGSANGTYLNGQEVTAATPVKENDEIKMGNLVFVLKTLGEKTSGEKT